MYLSCNLDVQFLSTKITDTVVINIIIIVLNIIMTFDFYNSYILQISIKYIT